MAGALTISTLNNDTGVLATQNGMTGIAKAWVVFAGATVSISQSFNVSSVTYVAAGRYTVNFTTAMPNANYAISGSGSDAITQLIVSFYSGGSALTTSCGISTTNTSSYADNSRISVVFHGA